MATQQQTQDFTDEIARRQERGESPVDRDEAIKAIRVALKRRTGVAWSVTGGRGTAWGWITITAPPKRRTAKWLKREGAPVGNGRASDYELVDTGVPQEFGYVTPADLVTLGEALGLERVHEQGVDIPAGTDYRIEYVARAEGRYASAVGVPYWD